MCSVDIKDAYYFITIQKDYQSFLKYCWKKELLRFVCFPNGLGPRPRKLMKECYHIISGHIDNFFSQGDTYNECVHNVIDMLVLLFILI